ncbi:MAG TPA: hypothetical protein VGC55_06445 [Dokdonella sp.]
MIATVAAGSGSPAVMKGISPVRLAAVNSMKRWSMRFIGERSLCHARKNAPPSGAASVVRANQNEFPLSRE